MLVTTPVEPASIAELRSIGTPDDETLPVNTLMEIVETVRPGIFSSRDVEMFPRTLTEIGDAHDLSLTEVLDLLQDFGTWLSQKDIPKVRTERPEPLVFASFDEARENLGVDYTGRYGFVDVAEGAPDHKMVGDTRIDMRVPYLVIDNINTKGTGRNLSGTFKNLVRYTPTEADVRRYLIRSNKNTAATPTWGVLSALHRFASDGLLDMIDESLNVKAGGEQSEKLAAAVVSAYDLLEQSRVRAVKAVGELRKFGETRTVDNLTDRMVERIVAHVERAWFLNEGALERIRQAAAAGDSGRWILVRELRFLAKTAETDPAWSPRHIGELTGGQVLRIASHAGIVCEPIETNLKNQIRDTIRDAGLTADKDELFPIGVRAIAHDLWDEFLAATEARAAGKLDWNGDLNKQFNKVTKSDLARR